MSGCNRSDDRRCGMEEGVSLSVTIIMSTRDASSDSDALTAV